MEPVGFGVSSAEMIFCLGSFKGMVHPKWKFHPSVTHQFVDVSFSNNALTFWSFTDGKNSTQPTPVVAMYSNVTTKTAEKHVSVLSVWCQPNVRKTQQSNLTHNGFVNTAFLAKVSAVASQPGAAFMSASTISARMNLDVPQISSYFSCTVAFEMT